MLASLRSDGELSKRLGWDKPKMAFLGGVDFRDSLFDFGRDDIFAAIV